MEDKKRTASEAIIDFGRSWTESVSGNTEYERGLNTGLMIALHIVREAERNA